MFNCRIENAIKYYNEYSIEKKTTEDIKSDINLFKIEYSKLLIPTIWDDENLRLKINEFDMLLTFYESLYNDASNSLLNNQIQIWLEEKRPFEFVSIYLFRFIIHDIFSLRNFCTMKFENQFNSTFRNLIEKVNIFALFMFDYYFSSNYAFNDEKWDDKKLYYNLVRPKAIRKRIENNYKEILDKEILDKENTNLETSKSIEMSFYELLLIDSIKVSYNLSSLFVHHNNCKELLKYYDEGNKFNISLKHNSAIYMHYRFDLVIEFLILIYPLIWKTFTMRGVSSDNKETSDFLIAGYYYVLLDEKYKE